MYKCKITYSISDILKSLN